MIHPLNDEASSKLNGILPKYPFNFLHELNFTSAYVLIPLHPLPLVLFNDFLIHGLPVLYADNGRLA